MTASPRGKPRTVTGTRRHSPSHSIPQAGVCAHPGACEYPGLRADSIRPYRAYAFIRVLAKNRGYGRLLAAPTGRMRSSGYLRKSGVAGGFYPPLQGVYAHPGTCGNPGLRAAEPPQQIAYANVPQAKNRPSACAEGQLIFSEVTITKPCKQRKRHCRAEQHQQLPSGRLRPEPEWSTRLRPQHGTGRQRSCACQRSTA